MKACYLAIAACVLCAPFHNACAQDDPLVQTGSWTCTGNDNCPKITFDTPFDPNTTPHVVTFFETKGGGAKSGMPPRCANDQCTQGECSASDPHCLRPWEDHNSPPAFIAPKDISPTGFTPNLSRGYCPTNNCAYGTWIAHGQPAANHVTVYPQYVVLTVLYAPPGTNAAHASSSAVYASGSTAGTTTSSSQTFKDGIGVSVQSKADLFGNGGGAQLAFSFDQSQTSTQTLDIKKSSATTLQVSGPNADGIDHGYDSIWLWLNPSVDVAVTTNSAAWTFNGTSTAVIQYVYLDWLANNGATMPATVKATLAQWGITPNDFAGIAGRDPWSQTNPTLDPARYIPLNQSFPYEPPPNGGLTPAQTYTFTYNTTSTNQQSSSDDFKVNVKITESVGADVLKADMTESAYWEWINSSTQSNSAGTTESAAVTIGGPSSTYTGSTIVFVYFDTIYKTFAFASQPLFGARLRTGPSASSSLKGHLVNASDNNKPLAGYRVTLFVNHQTYQTYTSSTGAFIFTVSGTLVSPLRLEAGGVSRSIPSSDFGTDITFKINGPPPNTNLVRAPRGK
jgi:hypothetical protein